MMNDREHRKYGERLFGGDLVSGQIYLKSEVVLPDFIFGKKWLFERRTAL